MNGRLKAGGVLLALALGFVGVLEGRSLTAYLDTGGVATICNGSTRGVKLGQSVLASECDAMFTADLIRHESAMLACLKRPQDLPDETYIAVLSFVYNVGGGQACASTLFRKLNAGDLRGACDQLPRWVRDNGRVIAGLVNRRVAERDLCRSGL
jgi:lysozyme